MLASHSGTVCFVDIWITNSKKILSIRFQFSGEVFDVTKGRGWYAPGGSYSFFAGRDAARAYATGCFKEHLTHDLRGLGENQLKVLMSCRDDGFTRHGSNIFYLPFYIGY